MVDPVSPDFDFIWQYRKSVKPDGNVQNYLAQPVLEQTLDFGTGGSFFL